MTTFVMAIKNSNGLVFKADASSLEEAYEYFAKLKQMPKEDFNKLFVVAESKKLKNEIH